MEAIKTEGLGKVYKSGFKKIKALENLSLSIGGGEVFGFLGPNAAGKTTTIKILTHLTFPTSGSAWVLGEAVGSPDVKHRIGYLPENPSFYPNLTAVELLSFYSQLFGLSGRRCRERIKELLNMVGLEQAGKLSVGSYSKGMLQRIGMAQSLLNDPDLVILDEPLAGVDPVGRKSLRDLILRLKKAGKTVFFSTHILQDVELICDRVGILINGRLVSVGRLADILTEQVESIEITGRDVSRDAFEGLNRIALHLVGDSDKWMVVVKDDAAVDRVWEIVSLGKGKINSIVPRTRTLEDHFIEKMRE